MPQLNDVQNFAVGDDLLFTWDAVPDATGYELRTGADWVNSTPLSNVTILGTSYAYTQTLDAANVLIKATAQGYDESSNAATVTTPVAPTIGDVQNLAVVADELTFDAVSDATGYEIRKAKSFQSDAGESELVATVSNNDPLSVPNSAGFRFFVRAFGIANTRSVNFSSVWIDFFTAPCGPSEPPNILDKIITFHIDWATGEIVEESATTTPSGPIPKNTRAAILKSNILAPNGEPLSDYEILSVNAQFYLANAVPAIWENGQSSTVRNAGSAPDEAYGLQSFNLSDEIAIRSGRAGFAAGENWNTLWSNIPGSASANPVSCRIEIKMVPRI